MLKSILKVNGAQQLSKNEQQSIKGGNEIGVYDLGHLCPPSGNCQPCPVECTQIFYGFGESCWACLSLNDDKK